MEFLKKAWRLAAALVAVFVLGTFAVFAFNHWTRDHEVKKRLEEKASVGPTASAAAAALWHAHRMCTVIGVSDVSTCAAQEGTLSEELAAQALASKALEQRRAFDKVCIKHFASEYCNSLLSRALQIARKSEQRNQ